MAGGTFSPGERKIRPGYYSRFVSEQQQLLGLSPKGVVIMPILESDFFVFDGFIQITIDDIDDKFSKLGYHVTDPKAIKIREILKNAIKVIVYNPQTGTKASAKLGEVTFEAKYAGTRGNSLKVVIKASKTSKMFQVYLQDELVFEQDGITEYKDIRENDWITVDGEGTVEVAAGIDLEGGTTVTATTSQIAEFLDDAETQEFNVMYLPSEEPQIISLFDEKIRYFVDSVGKYVFGVRPLSTVKADYQFMSSIRNGVILNDGTVLDATTAAAGYAGMSAACQPYESLTYVKYQGAKDVHGKLKHNEIVEALKGGEIVFTFQDGNVVIEQDINSLTTITKNLDESYKKNRVMRTYTEVQNLCTRVLRPNKYDNNDDGIAQVVDAINSQVLLNLQTLNALKNVDTATDVIVDFNKTKGDEFHADVHIQPVDSIEKFYITFKTSY